MRLTEVDVCPICEGGYRSLGSTPTICPDCPDRPELRACRSCGHWWHSPVPDQDTLHKLYASASRYVVGEDGTSVLTQATSLASFDRFALDIIRRVERGPYLEIGAGGGQMLNQVRRLGFECYGVDPGQWVADAAIRRDLNDWPKELTFNIFLLKDVIEHVLDPLGLLKRLRRRANSGAILIATFPCCDSKPAQRNGVQWNMVRPYGHLHYFSMNSASALFQRSGWKAEYMRLARVRSMQQLLVQLRFRLLAYELLLGRPDQLHIYASA